MKLIVKADDYGTTEKVSEGILHCMKEGIVRDTSFLVNSPHFDFAVKRAFEEGITAMGLHLTFTYRAPLLPANELPSITNTQGQFYRKRGDIDPSFSISELEKEWRAQIKKFQSTGLTLTHLDTHHHIHTNMGDAVTKLYIKLGKELNVPVRRPNEDLMNYLNEQGVKTTDIMFIGFGGQFENSTVDTLLDFLKLHEGFKGSIELMCHPGYSDDELVNLSSWNKCREVEVDALISPEVLQYIQDQKIELMNFNQL